MKDKSAEMQELVVEMDRKMSARSFQYFFETVLEFDYANHHGLWDKGLADNRYYCVKASRDHGKSVFFMSYALWIAAFNPGTHIMIFSHSLEQTLEHMRFIRNNIQQSPCLKDLIPSLERQSEKKVRLELGMPPSGGVGILPAIQNLFDLDKATLAQIGITKVAVDLSVRKS